MCLLEVEPIEMLFGVSTRVNRRNHLYLKMRVAKVSCYQSARDWLRRLPLATGHYYYYVICGSCTGVDYDCVIDVVGGQQSPYSWIYSAVQAYIAAIKVKGKLFPYSLPSVGPGADPGVQAVSPQVT